MNLAIFHNLPPGGGRRSAFEWVKILRHTYEIDLYTFDDTDEFCDLSAMVSNSFKIRRRSLVKGRGFVSKLISLLEIEIESPRVAKLINLKNYDAVLVLQCKVCNSPPVLRYLKGNVVYYCQEPAARVLEPHYINGKTNSLTMILRGWFVRYDEFNAKYSPIILCNSRFSMESLYRSYRHYARVVYLGIDPDLFLEKPVEDKDPSFILSVGHLTRAKGHDFVISSLAKIDAEKRPSFFVVYKCEDPGFREYLTELARNTGVDLVLLDSVSDVELVSLYGTAKVVVCAARLEPLGLSPLEAMACGTPVLGVAEGGIRETVISGVNGMLVDRDEYQFAAALEKMYSDDLFYRSLAKKCRDYVEEKWTWADSAKKLISSLQL